MFSAKPCLGENDLQDLFKWECSILGVENTEWYGGKFKLTMYFEDDYPAKPPRCKFEKGFYHPNVYPSGTICHSILTEDEGWKPIYSIEVILFSIQQLLSNPNPNSPA